MRGCLFTGLFSVALRGCAPARGIDFPDSDWKWRLPGRDAAATLHAPKDEDSSLIPGRLGFSVVEREGRIVVNTVGASTSAARAGVLAGDIVLRYDGEVVSGARQLYRRMVDSFPGSVVTLEVLRAGSPQRFSIRVDAIDTTPRA